MSPSTFTPDTASSLGGPSWLRARRIAAAEAFAAHALPSKEEEVWRYSRIGDLDLERYAPVTAASMACASRSRPSEWRSSIAQLKMVP